MAIRKKPEDKKDRSRYFVWLEEPAVYVDTFSAKIFETEGILRLVLGESLGSREFYPLWRTAIAMPVEDARRLSVRLTELFQKYDESIDETSTVDPTIEHSPTSSDE